MAVLRLKSIEKRGETRRDSFRFSHLGQNSSQALSIFRSMLRAAKFRIPDEPKGTDLFTTV
jgi:hypothetical protein